jgi:tetratricopeptide (TPR) repeat protein
MIAAVVLAIAHYGITTTQPLAQQRFDTALTDLYAFDGADAAIEFDGAAITDPQLAIAFWGKALAEGSDLNHALTEERFARAQTDIARAAALETYASPSERALIDAVALRYAGKYSAAARDEAAYETAMRSYVAAHPTDDDAATLLVEALIESHGMTWTDGGSPANAVSGEILNIVHDVLARDPTHLFANHLCIHVYDTAPDRTFAIACAQRLDAMTFGPGEEHLAHMPAHLWIEIGDGEKALASSARAWALQPTEYASHDAFVALLAALIAGDRAAALQWSARLAALGPYHEEAVIDGRTGAWNDAAPALTFAPKSSDAAVLEARRDEEHGNTAGAIALLLPLEHSVRLAGEMVPFFPPDEALGAIYYRAGRFADAAQTFSTILATRPDDPRALFGMWQTSLALNDATNPARYAALFPQYWAGGTLTMNDF